MGRKKKGYNWKARDQPNGEIDNDEIRKLNQNVAPEVKDKEKYEGSNALVLPANKLKFKKEKEIQPVGRILSKKQRKRLEKIVDLKKKKAERGDLLEALAKVQADPSVIAGLETLSSAQTKGVKRQLVEETHSIKIMQTQGKSLVEVQEELRAAKRKKLRIFDPEAKKKKLPTGQDVLGFDSESSDESESDDDEPENEKVESDVSASHKDTNDNIDGANEDRDVTPSLAQNCNKSEDSLPETDVNNEESDKKDVTIADDGDVKKIEKSSYKPVKSVVFVPVQRDPDIIASRNKLPIIGEEQNIMESINSSQVVVLSGETGSGKTTQVPQFLYEAGYAADGKIIGITEPRRVAATAMSERVAKELGLPTSEVSYQIRFQGNVTPDTKIKFMTDGVLLREVEKDFLLSKYSVIILDEAHERSVFTDILIGLLSRIVPLRHKKNDPLKLIIMSATLRVEDFTQNDRLFKTVPPVISVESRQFPVTVHFNKHTKEDYLSEAYKKVCKIHRELPDGGILVFVTGQSEVNQLVNKLRKTFPGKYSDTDAKKKDTQSKEKGKSYRKRKKSKSDSKEAGNKVVESLPEIDLDNYRIQPADQLECEGDLSDQDEDEEDLGIELEAGEGEGGNPLHVLPLYSLLPQDKQNRIFQGAPDGSRLCVVATNIAETSLTIPGVKYVVDTGKVKTKFYDKVTGVTTFVVTWTSKAAANQRAGRAGRTAPGHTYRLYSSAVFNNDLKEFAPPEIQEKPADGVLLQMKAMNIDKVVNFPFPSPPDKVQLRTAEERLQMLGLLSLPPPNIPLKEMEKIKYTSKVTSLGKVVASLPVSPRFGKILALSHQQDMLPLSIALVSVLSVQEVLVETGIGGDTTNGKPPKQLKQIRRDWCGQGATLSLGDPMVLLSALCIAERTTTADTDKLCASIGLRPKALKEIRKLRRQLCTEVEAIIPNVGQLLQPGLTPPDQVEARLLQQLLLAGCGDQVARRIQQGEPGYVKGGYKVGQMEQPAFIHSASVLKKQNPDWILFQEIFETDKMYMRGVTEVKPEWLPKFVPGLCNLGKVLEEPEPRYCQESGTVRASFNGTYGPGAFPLPLVEVEYPQSMVDKYKLFSRFILEGKVCGQLAKFTSSLLSNPIIMTKAWSNLQPRTEKLYRALAAAKVDSGHLLKKKFATDDKFLLAQYLDWVPEVLHPDVQKIWPPIVEL